MAKVSQLEKKIAEQKALQDKLTKLAEELKALEEAKGKADVFAASVQNLVAPDGDFSKAVKALIENALTTANILLPEKTVVELAYDGQAVNITVSPAEEPKTVRVSSGNGKVGGGGTPVRVDGVEYKSGAEACRALGIDQGVGSAQAALAKALKAGKIKSYEVITS